MSNNTIKYELNGVAITESEGQEILNSLNNHMKFEWKSIDEFRSQQ